MSEHTLVVLRHAKSNWSGGEPDAQRPLAQRGRRQAAEAGRWLATHVDRLDLAVVSSAVRARDTWDLASAELASPPPIRVEERAYAASGGALLGLLRELDDEASAVVLVGHNPGLEDLVATLTDQWVPMPTSAIAVLGVPGPWSGVAAATAELRTSGRPPARAPGG